MNWPILSTVTFLPLAGAAIVFLFIHGDSDAHRRNILNVSLGVTLLTFVVSLLIWWNFDQADPGFQFVERAGAARLHDLFDGRRRHLDAVRDPDDVPDADLRARKLEIRPAPAQGIHGLLPGPGDA